MNNSIWIACALVLATASGAMARAGAPDPAGDWRGSISAGAVKLRVALHLGEKFTFDSPDQGAIGLGAQMKAEGSDITAAIAGVGIFKGVIAADGKSLDGVLVQGATSIPIRFDRGIISAANRPQTPHAPFPYRTEEVGFDNPREPGVHLAGTLTLPQGGGPAAAVLLITGSGAQDRDETLFEHKPFLVLADALTRRGIAVLRLDDRGVGGSTGGSPDATTADFATDVEAAIAWLKKHKDVDANRVGLLGQSEGGVVATIVAGRDPSLAFAVLWAAPGVRGKETMVEQARAITIANGATDADARRTASLQGAILDVIMSARDTASARVALAEVMKNHGAPSNGDAQLAQMMSPWYRYFLAFDPTPDLGKIKVPLLALLGSKDVAAA